jgi:hypothetical protein
MVGLGEAGRAMPELLGLKAVPNPCSGRTEFGFNVAPGTPYQLRAYALDGSLVLELHGTAGGRTLVPCDLAGVAKGVYLFRLTAGNAAASGRLVVTD